MVIALCWTLFVSITFINEYFFIADLIKLQKLRGSYAFWPDFTGQMFMGAFGGLVGGYILVFRMDKAYKQKSFAFGIINAGMLFLLYYLTFFTLGLFFLAFIYFTFQMNVLTAAIQAWDNLLINLNSPSFLLSIGITGFLVSGTQFMLQVNDKFGQGVLWKFMTGKYYHPREEERIFMFLDLKASTTIAEKIGSKHFFELLREVYRDITEPVIYHKGEIYQYVGDEVVITWPVQKGLKENNCLTCFFDIEKVIEEKKNYYLEKYGHIPTFKAGLHLGEATVGEIGVIKKDIVFSGDVLNTTSRIQGECNHHAVNVLLSTKLLQRLPLKEAYHPIPIGEIHLRGKTEKVSLNTVKLIQS